MMATNTSQRPPAGVEGLLLAAWTRSDGTGPHLQRRLADLFRGLLHKGDIPLGAPLPTTRALAILLECSRNTVRIAYDQLIAEGYFESFERRGTFAARVLPENRFGQLAVLSEPAQSAFEATLSQYGEELESLPGYKATGVRTFWPHETDARAFPFAIWSRLFARHWRDGRDEVLRDHDPAGHLPLREAIVALVREQRGIVCDASQVIISNGGAASIAFLISLLVNRGDEIWLEEANTSNVPTAIHMAGGRSIFVPVDEQGLSVDAGRTLCPRARMAVVNPYSAYPAGKVMSLERRKALLAWAEEAGAIIIEDDFGSEFLFHGRRVPAISALDHHRRSFYIGTFSNYLFPSLRLNYIIAPPALASRIVSIRYKLEFHPPMALQPVVASFLGEGHLARHVRRMQRIYAARREALRVAFAEHLSDSFDLDLPWAGLNGIARLRRHITEAEERALVARAMDRGVGLTPLRCGYYQAARGTEILVGFGAPSEAEIAAGARRLAHVMAELN